MRHVLTRSLRPLLALACIGIVSVPAMPADAAPVFSGRVVDSWSGVAVAGVPVAATDAAGIVVPGSSAVTAADGSFTLPDLDGEEYGITVDARTVGYERGFVGGAGMQPVGRSVYSSFAEAMTFAPQALGKIGVDGRLFTGRVVDSTTGVPLAGVTVGATDTNGVVIAGTAVVTDAAGRFRVAGDLDEEHGVWFDGNAVSHERGWLGGEEPQPVGRSVVGTWGEAATWMPGKLGTIGLDAIRAPLAPVKVSLVSPSKASLTLRARQNALGDRATGFEVRCSQHRSVVTRSYRATGQTRTGFRSGANTCRVRGVNTAGAGPWVIVATVVQ